MKLTKPLFWKSKNIISILLLPLTIITLLINISKRIYSKKKFFIKTICIGNIFLGGTGKTSLAIEIEKLLGKKFKTVFIKKDYQNQIDEINLLKNRGDVISKNNREDALSLASKKYDLAILDDGLQQKNINYGLKIVCFNTKDGLGNEFLLPAGPLRESIDQLKDYDIAFLNGESRNKNLLLRLKSINKKLKIFKGKYKPENLGKFNLKKKYLMFCGIGNPHEFEKTLKKYKFNIIKKIIFPDHYKITPQEIKRLKSNAK
ncbi:tetraacyldisaccharide 4'-kinase, partial [Candidatus Pelagibacter sp.]|nr:tetraacyldisaccharide 4'-kinase [Candidatus Pelagibacter sp.]